jgi:prepilin-type N-terminal cleavage/methylation domain-containing protein
MIYRKSRKSNEGFTLIELLIVIAIIAVIASVTFVALNPLQRFREARDSTRWSDVNQILSAIKIDQIDNGGEYNTEIKALTDGTVYMIGTAGSGCDDNNGNCDTNVTNDTACVDLTRLSDEGYLPAVPISPGTTTLWSATITGYTLTVTSSIATVKACQSEDPDSGEISAAR